MTVRRLDPTLWRMALDLRVAALTESPEAFGSTVERERGLSETTWRARLTDNAWFAAFESLADGRIAVGLACGIHTQEPDVRELTAVWVAPGHRGTGLGDVLVSAVRDWAARGGASRLTLQVVGTNSRAVDLYARHGFEPSGRAATAGDGARQGDVLMSLDLTTPGPPG